jgi:molybdopterin synthase sulfur carrier subunit
MSTIRLPTPLRPYTSGRKEIEVHGETVGAALQDLVRQHPGLRSHLYDPDGQLRKYINLFVNEEDVRQLQGESTALHEQDRLVIIPSIAGGMHRNGERTRRPCAVVDGWRLSQVQSRGVCT